MKSCMNILLLYYKTRIFLKRNIIQNLFIYFYYIVMKSTNDGWGFVFKNAYQIEFIYSTVVSYLATSDVEEARLG